MALTIVTRADQKSIAEIEKLIARKIDWQEGAAMPSDDEEAPAREHRGAGRGRRGAVERPKGDGESRSRQARQAERGQERPHPDRHAERSADSRRHRAERPDRERPATQPARGSASQPVRFADPSPRRIEHPRRDNDGPVIGLGDHVPGFLLRPVPKRVRQPQAQEHVEAED